MPGNESGLKYRPLPGIFSCFWRIYIKKKTQKILRNLLKNLKNYSVSFWYQSKTIWHKNHYVILEYNGIYQMSDDEYNSIAKYVL